MLVTSKTLPYSICRPLSFSFESSSKLGVARISVKRGVLGTKKETNKLRNEEDFGDRRWI